MGSRLVPAAADRLSGPTEAAAAQMLSRNDRTTPSSNALSMKTPTNVSGSPGSGARSRLTRMFRKST